MDRETIVKTVVIEGVKATPPVAALAINAAKGWTMTDVAAAVTIAYVLLQAAYLLWKWRNERADRRARKAQEVQP